jgi:hypothetical protein
MYRKGFGPACALALLMFGAMTASAAAQVPAEKKVAKAPAAPAAKKYTPPHLAWGHPNLQGIWNNGTTTPLERPKDLADREFLSEKEWADRAKEVATRAEKRPDDALADIELAYNNEWWDRGAPLLRTSLITEPRNGMLPALTAEGQKLVAAREAVRKSHGPADSWEDRPLQERCILYHGVPPFPTGYNNNYQIAQTADYVAIRYEMMAETRIIPLDGRPHRGPKVRQWMGNTRGHFEGDTLVVETTDYSDKTTFRFPAANDSLRIIEHFTRTDADTIDYQFTVDNPVMYSKQWSAVLPLKKAPGPILEYACHEGNYGIMGVLRGNRVQEAEAAAKKKAAATKTETPQ